jgi:hypothetical protein
VRVVPAAPADLGRPSIVERLLGEAQHPAGHRDRDLSGGEVDRPAGTSCREHITREVGRCPARGLVLLLEPPVPLPQLPRSRSSAESSPAADGPAARPSSRSAIRNQQARQDSEIPKLRATWAIDWAPRRVAAITSRPNSSGQGVRKLRIAPGRTNPHRQGVNRTLGSPHRTCRLRAEH